MTKLPLEAPLSPYACEALRLRAFLVAPHYGGAEFDPINHYSKTVVTGTRQELLVSTTLTEALFKNSKSRILGGRYCYNIQATDPSTWNKRSWHRRLVQISDNYTGHTDVSEVSSDPKPLIERCLSLPLDSQGYPQ